MAMQIKSNPFADLARNCKNTHMYKQTSKKSILRQNIFQNRERQHRSEAKEKALRKC